MIHGHMGQLKEQREGDELLPNWWPGEPIELPVELSTELTSQRSTALNKLRESMHVALVLAWIAGQNEISPSSELQMIIN
jgi:hypothetical protein